MSDKEKIERAAEIQKAIDDADKRKRADEEASGQHLDKLLTNLDGCVKKMDARLDAMSKRLDDAMDDDARRNRHRDDARRRKDARLQDDDDDAFAEQPNGDDEEERKLHEEGEAAREERRALGEARPVVADADVMRRHALADAQAQADACAASWGQRADAPLAGESVRAYRCRQLRRYQRYSPMYKQADLDSIADEAVFRGVEEKIYTDACLAADSPDSVPAGTLRMVTKRMPSGHIENTFIGSPHAWMGQFAYGRSRFVTAINPKPNT